VTNRLRIGFLAAGVRRFRGGEVSSAQPIPQVVPRLALGCVLSKWSYLAYGPRRSALVSGNSLRLCQASTSIGAPPRFVSRAFHSCLLDRPVKSGSQQAVWPISFVEYVTFLGASP
jgi:hypothetical protein